MSILFVISTAVPNLIRILEIAALGQIKNADWRAERVDGVGVREGGEEEREELCDEQIFGFGSRCCGTVMTD